MPFPFPMSFLLSGNPLHTLDAQVFGPRDLLRGRLVTLLVVGAYYEDSSPCHKEAEEAVWLRFEHVQLFCFLVEFRLVIDLTGHGVEAVVDGRRLLLGNLRLMKEREISVGSLEEEAQRLADDGKTPLYTALDGKAAGLIAVADTVKEDSARAIRVLRRMGIEVVMITGDNERTARAVAKQVGIDRVLSEVLPQDKARNLQKLQQEGKKVGMVGDGINDAPALAQADVGFAIGSGTDVAIEASDITLIKGSLLGVVTAIQISRATMRNVFQNLAGAFLYNTLGIPIAMGLLFPFFGILLSPLIAAAAMSFSSVTVISNANRLKLWKPDPRLEGGRV